MMTIWVQKPPTHAPEQQSALAAHALPSGAQSGGAAHVPPVHTLEQHCALVVQVPAVAVHAIAHSCVAGSQVAPLQHCASVAHAP
jgi:hypothetical protein